MHEPRAVGALDWAFVGGDVIGVEDNSPFHHCWRPPKLKPVDSYWTGAQQPNGITILVDVAKFHVILALIRWSMLSAMKLFLLGEKCLSIEGHTRLLPRELGVG